MASPKPIPVLLIPFPDFNTLDLNGPLEILGSAALPKYTFAITIAAKEDLTTAIEKVIIKHNISLKEVRTSLEDCDILIPAWRRS